MELFKTVPAVGDAPDGREYADLQRRLELVINPIAQKLPLNGVLLSGVVLTTGAECQVEHGLGRSPLGWFVSRPLSAAILSELSTSTADRTKYLPIVASANCTVDLWVF